jgi:predicted MFS family arabinose efflux permease
VQQERALSRPVIALIAMACGVSVANIYFPQAVVPLIAADLGTSAADAALVATAAQVGYAAGLFLLVPLGDRMRYRALVPALLVITSAGLLAAALTPTLPALVVCSALVGFATVVPQILLPMAAGMTAASRRAAVTGSVLSGLLGGILLARTFGGLLGGFLGWRAPYLCAAGLALVLAAVLVAVIPWTSPASTDGYGSLLATALRLLRTEPDLRISGGNQALMFGAFSAAWTCLALLVTGPTYREGPQAVGLIALVGAASVLVTPAAGRLTDRLGPAVVNRICFLIGIAAIAVLAVAGIGHAIGMIALCLGMLALDVAVQSGQVANQTRIFALRPEVRARLNTAYMTCAFVGGSLGTVIGVRCYDELGWFGLCVLLAAAPCAGLVRARIATRRADARV